jgi:hypothetical protein
LDGPSKGRLSCGNRSEFDLLVFKARIELGNSIRRRSPIERGSNVINRKAALVCYLLACSARVRASASAN